MKSIDCDIIQDLLPSYNDKISSTSTNNLVEEHLKECENCKMVLKNMNKSVNTEILNDEVEQINYLKGYKKKRKLLIILSIILTIVVLGAVFIVNIINKNILVDRQLYVDVNKFNVEYMYMKEYKGEFETTTDKCKVLEVYLYSDEYKYMYLTGGCEYGEETKEIYYKIASQELPKGIEFDGSGLEMRFEINDNIEKVYIEDTKHNVKEIWNKDMEVESEEEWRKWYIDSYVPTEIKELYNMSYDNIPVSTSIWKHLYNKNLENENVSVRGIKKQI